MISAAGLLIAGCAGELAVHGSGKNVTYQHRDRAYRIGAPATGDTGVRWKRIKVKGADLSFRGNEGSNLAMLSRCRKTAASIQLQARQLLIGLRNRKFLQSGPIAHGDAKGWGQTLTAEQEGQPMRLRTATIRSGACTFDWVLVTAESTGDRLDATFDSWIASFDHPGTAQRDDEEPE